MTAKAGDTVFVHYTGTLDDGTEFDSSRDRDPLEFVLGRRMVIPGFEKAVTGLSEGDTVRTVIAPEDGYGEPSDDMVIIVPRGEVPAHIKPEVGQALQLSLQDGVLNVVVSRVDENELELDGNHPLAGKTLTFDLEVVKIKAA
jgi:peptidylprolyl isomerase